MKSNAIIRIITWSLVILVLLAILTAGLGFRGISLHWRWDDDDVPAETAIPQQVEPTEAHVYMETTFYAAESISIHEKPSEQSKIKSVIEPGDTVHLGQDQLINGQHWGYITAPGAGWILLEDDAEASLPAETEVPLSLNYKVKETTNIRATPSPDGKVLGSVEAGERVTLKDTQVFDGHHWAHIEGPVQGWILLEELGDSVEGAQLSELIIPAGGKEEYTVTEDTNLRILPGHMNENIGTIAAGQTVSLTQIQRSGDHYWGHILEPQEGWFLLIDYVADSEEAAGETVPSTAPNGSGSAATISPSEEAPDVNYYRVNAADISDISIEWASGSIRIIPTDGDQINVTEAGDFGKNTMELKQKNGKLSIAFSQPGLHLGGASSKDLTIQIPKTHILRELEIEAASAAVLVQGLEIQHVEIDSASGASDFQECNIHSLEIDTTSGDIHFSGTLNTLECDAASANFVGILSNVPRGIEMESMSGNLDLTLPENAGYTVTMEGVNTRLSSDFETTRNGNAHVSGDGACRIQMEAMNAEVIIRKAK